MLTKKELKSFIADGKTTEVLTELKNLSIDNITLHNEVLHVFSKFTENERQRRLDITRPEDVRQEHNRITSNILSIIDMIPDEKYFEEEPSLYKKLIHENIKDTKKIIIVISIPLIVYVMLGIWTAIAVALIIGMYLFIPVWLQNQTPEN